MKYYLGLDNGGTVTKAVLYTAEGEEVSAAAVDTAMLTPRPGFTERDMEEMWRANCAVVRQAAEKRGIDPQDIAGLAICGHGKGLYLWGKDDKPTRNGIISTDNRAWEYVQNWRGSGVEDAAFQLSCQHVLACQPVALLAWLKDNEPEAYQNIQWVFECKDYVRFRLTGEARAEITDYSGAHLLNLKTGQYDTELLRLFGLEALADALPPLCGSTEVCGYVTKEAAQATGLKEGTPVAGGMFDIDACALAVDITDEAHLCMIAGTWSINEYIRRGPVTDGSVLMNSLYCMPGYYLIEECSPTSAGNNEWFIQTLLPELKEQYRKEGKRIYEITDSWVEALPPEEFCPIFLPFLLASNVHPNAMGSFVGLSNYHTRAHLMRGVYEGIAFSHRYHLEKLLATREAPVKSIRLAGGAARSKVWTQMFADVMKLPIETTQVNEAGALGCAMAAAVAAGEYENLREAAKNMCRINPTLFPNLESAAVYDRKYAMYQSIIEALDPVWDEMQRLK